MNGGNPFYNPFMKGPDWGAGIQGLGQNIMMMMLMKKMFPGGGQKKKVEGLMGIDPDLARPNMSQGMQPKGGPVTPQGQPRSQEELMRMLMQLMGMGGQMGRMPF